MNARDNSLDGALQKLREASNPGADERQRIFAAVQGLARGAVPRASESAGEVTPRPPAPDVPASATWLRKLQLWGSACGLAIFAAGFVLGRGSLVVAPLAAPTPVASYAPAPPEAARGEARVESAVRSLDDVEPVSELAHEPSPDSRRAEEAPSTAARSAAHPAKPRARAKATARAKPAQGAFSLAEALQLLHRSERAIYSGQAVWALSLLDELDARAPRAMLREERIATRILALCGHGQVEAAEKLAAEARSEAPGSIYGALLERACSAPSEMGTASPVLPPGAETTRP